MASLLLPMRSAPVQKHDNQSKGAKNVCIGKLRGFMLTFSLFNFYNCLKNGIFVFYVVITY